MKKTLLFAALTAAFSWAGTASSQAQTLLDEGFEIAQNEVGTKIAVGDGWTTVDSYTGDHSEYRWHNDWSTLETGNPTITGHGCAAVDGPTYSSDPKGGFGPREEILLTPELDLNNTYQLQFTFRVSPMNAYDASRYDLQVRVVENGNLQGAETIFSIQDKNFLKESGINVYPIGDWSPYVAQVDLSDWKGKKVKLAFVYKMYQQVANIVWLDDVSVKQFTPPTGPEPKLSMGSYTFPEIYIGEKFYSEIIRLTNTGTKGLKISGIDLPNGVSTTLDYQSVDLDKNSYVEFQLAYSAAMTTPASGNVVIHTNGGDATIAFTATKQVVPEGYTLETFNEYYPPAGWQSNGWGGTYQAIEGDMSAYASGGFSNAYLTSPRLNLSKGGKVTFTYYNDFTSEDGSTVPEYDISLQLSTDGGKTWTTKWTSDYINGLNQLLTQTVDLGTGTDNSYIRWWYPEVEMDEEGYAYDHSSFTLDRVLLPSVYGADGLPLAAGLVSPEDGAEGIFARDIVLEWSPAQFAYGYKLYVGSNDAANNLVNGIDLGKALTYTIPAAEYSTTYVWKVVPYNNLGDAMNVPEWKFTTQPDASTASYPYYQNFDDLTDIPNGWLSTTTAEWANRRWELIRTDKAYGGQGASLYTMWLNAGKSSTVTTQEFRLPADKPMAISFVWGDNHPASLVVDESGALKKQNVNGGNGYSDVVFEVYADGQWKQEAYLSENYREDGDTKYWRNETISLAAYAGKSVMFRWTNNSYGGAHRGAGLDNIAIEEQKGDLAIFNKPDGWLAGKVNSQKAVNSGKQYTLINKGSNELVVKSATFAKQNFTTSIAAGDKVKVGDVLTFDMQFNALSSVGTVADVLTIEFESGYKVELPVEGEALAADVRYYSFEPNPLEYNWEEDFTMIDADNSASFSFSAYWIHYSKDGQRSAFSAESDDMETGMYGIMAPVSGTWALVGASPTEAVGRGADNWIVYRLIKATDKTHFDFYARNWESAQSVMPSPAHHVEVLVSESSNTQTTAFQTVMRDTEMPFLDGKNWNHYDVDLSSYAGRNIYIAVRHTTTASSNVAFFDDFTVSNFEEPDPTAISQIDNNGLISIYTLDGKLVANGDQTTISKLKKGIYVVKSADSGKAKTLNVR